MFDTIIKPKLKILFNDLRKKISKLFSEDTLDSNMYDKAVNMINSEVILNSKLILGDLLLDLTNEIMVREFNDNIPIQNEFNRRNYRSEIMANYKFVPDITCCFDNKLSIKHSIKVMAASIFLCIILLLLFYFVTDIFVLNNLFVIILLLLVSTIAGVVDYFYIEPARNKKRLEMALNKYLLETEQQLLEWYNEISKDFYNKVDSFKKELIKE